MELEESGSLISQYTIKLVKMVIKTVWSSHHNRLTDQWNSIESPEIKPHNYNQKIFGKRDKNIQWEKKA